MYQHFPFQGAPKCTKIGIFGTKINHLATQVISTVRLVPPINQSFHHQTIQTISKQSFHHQTIQTISNQTMASVVALNEPLQNDAHFG
jgi:hypothetical protein